MKRFMTGKLRLGTIWRISLPVIVMCSLLWLFLRQREILASFSWRVHWGSLFMVVFFNSLAFATTALAWHLIIASSSGSRNHRIHYRIYGLSLLSKRIPSSIPYLADRVAMYRQVDIPAPIVLNCSIIEMLLFGLGGGILFVATSIFGNIIPQLSLYLWIVNLSLAAVVFADPKFTLSIINKIFSRLGHTAIEVIPGRTQLLKWAGIYITTGILGGIAMFYIPRSLSIDNGPGLMESIQISSLTMIVMTLNWLMQGGFGLKELALGFIWSKWMPLSVAMALGIGFRIVQTLSDLGWYLIAAKIKPAGKGTGSAV